MVNTLCTSVWLYTSPGLCLSDDQHTLHSGMIIHTSRSLSPWRPTHSVRQYDDTYFPISVSFVANILCTSVWRYIFPNLGLFCGQHTLYLSMILLVKTINRWMTGGNQSTPRKPLTTSFRKCHILKPENSCPNPDSNPYSSIGGRLGKPAC